MKKYLLILFLLLIISNSSHSQTIGLLQHSTGLNDDGYVLFAPMSYTKTYLINKCGKLVHSWTSTYRPGLSACLMNDGTLLRTGNTNNTTFDAGGSGGILQKIDWNNDITWSYTISSSLECQHHDAIALDNGNILTIVWVKKTSAEAIAAGRNPATIGTELWSEKLIELQPTGTNTANIVWQWNVWDHLIQDFDASKPNYGVVSEHPELINLNYTGSGSISDPDWLHLNSIDYNPAFNQVMVSSHDLSEIWVIDRDNSAGGLVYRWGNPAVYNRGTVANQKLFGQHDAKWIKSGFNFSGAISIFNNGLNRTGGNYSSADIIYTPVDASGNYSIQVSGSYLPDSAYWSYKDPVPSNFYSQNISGVQELNNGNFLISNGPAGILFEINSLKQTVWKYINPVNQSGPMQQGIAPTQNLLFRSVFYRSNFSGFTGHSLIPGDPIELNPINYTCELVSGIQTIGEPVDFELYQNYPNPFNPETNISFSLIKSGLTVLKVYDVLGKEVAMLVNENLVAGRYDINFNSGSLPSGIYYYTLSSGNTTQTKKMILLK